MSVEGELGKITGLIEGMSKNIDDKFESQEKKLDNFRTDIKEVFGDIRENGDAIVENTSNIKGLIKDIHEDVKPSIEKLDKKIDKRSTAVGGASGGIGAMIMMAAKEAITYFTGGSN